MEAIRNPFLRNVLQGFYNPEIYRDAQRRRQQYLRLVGAVGASTAAYLVKKYVYAEKPKNKILPTTKMVVRRTYASYRPRSKKSTRSKFARSSKYTQQKNGGRVTSRRKTYKRKTKKPLTKQVKELSRMVKSDQAYHRFKVITSDEVGPNTTGTCVYKEYVCNTATKLQTAMANLRYYDPSTPGTLTTANASTGTYSREVHVKNVYAKLYLRNNYQSPCRMKVYLVMPKADTNIVPLTWYTNGITDQVISGGNATTPGLFLSDIDQFTGQWKMKCLKDVILDSGSELIVTHSTGPFDFDPSVYDSHALDYQTKWKAFSFIVRLEGVVAHDSSAAEYGTLVGSADTLMSVITDFVYDAGVNLNDIYISDTRATGFTNGGLITSKPVADNIGYSAN